MAGLEPRLTQFGPAFGWLLDKGVSSARVASLFGTTSANVRVIAYRDRHGAPVEQGPDPQLIEIPGPALKEKVGIRTAADEVVRTPATKRKVDWLLNELEKRFFRNSSNYEFLAGVHDLRQLLPQIGYAGDTQRIALLALLHQHMSWFLVHSGRCHSATREAQLARDLWRVAYHESGCGEYVERFVQASLIGSQAWLLSRRPWEAMQSLDLARDASESIRAPLGSEYFRQRGVALFQLREDQQAAQHFQTAAETMERMNEATVPEQLLMTGARHISMLKGLDCDQAGAVLNAVQRAFGTWSLEASMALHWASACSLSTDSTTTVQQMMDLLTTTAQPFSQFGHQATIRKLLAVTPELGLDIRLRRVWVRRALYENAFRDR